MNKKITEKFLYNRYFLTAILLAGMFLAAQLTGHNEIVFPEIFAIITGCLIIKKIPWNTSDFEIIVLTTIAALIGVIAVKYVPVPIYWKILLNLLLTELLLVISKTNFVPIIPAGIFPIFMNVTSFVYPIAVLVMTLLIVICRRILVKGSYNEKSIYKPENINQNADFIRYLKLFLIFSLLSIIPMVSGKLFWLSPPVVVTYVELSAPKSMNRNRALIIWQVMVIAALIGTVFRLIFNIYYDLPLIVAGILACTIYIIYCYKKNVFYPPASGALLMPLILRQADLLWYPFEVAIGLAILIPVSLYLFPTKCLQHENQ